MRSSTGNDSGALLIRAMLKWCADKRVLDIQVRVFQQAVKMVILYRCTVTIGFKKARLDAIK